MYFNISFATENFFAV